MVCLLWVKLWFIGFVVVVIVYALVLDGGFVVVCLLGLRVWGGGLFWCLRFAGLLWLLIGDCIW